MNNIEKCLTLREQFHHERPEGEAIYESNSKATRVERSEDRLVIKVWIDKGTPWDVLESKLSEEVRQVQQWAYEMRCCGLDIVSDDVVIESIDEIIEQRKQIKFDEGYDPWLYQYFNDLQHWVMYENDELYLFRYDVPYESRRVQSAKSVSMAIERHIMDDLWSTRRFLVRWFKRVNGEV